MPRGNPNWHVGMPSPNASGRPKDTLEARARMRKIFLEQGIDAVVQIAFNDPTSKVRLDALKWLGEMALGKAPQPITGDDEASPLRIIIE